RNGLTAVSHLRETGQRASAPPKERAGAHKTSASRPAANQLRKEPKVRRSARFRNPFKLLFATQRREQYVERYALREHRKGRSLAEILEDPYVQAWSTPSE